MILHEYGTNKPYEIRAISIYNLEQVEFPNGDLHTKIWDDPCDDATLLEESIAQIIAAIVSEEYARGKNDGVHTAANFIDFRLKIVASRLRMDLAEEVRNL